MYCESYRLDFFTVQCHFIPKTCLFVNCSNSNACIMVLSKLTFVLLCSPFLSWLRHRWQFVLIALWLQCEIWGSTELAGALLTLFIAWNAVQSSWKWCIVMYRNWAAHLLFWLLIGVRALATEHSEFSVKAGLIVEMLFMLSFVYNAV